MKIQRSFTETLEKIVGLAQKTIQSSKLNEWGIYKNDKSVLENWAEEFNKKAQLRGVYKLFPILESKKGAEYRKKAQKTAELCEKTYKFIQEIANAEKNQNLEDLKTKLLSIEKSFLDTEKNPNYLYCNVPSVIEDSLFEYKEIVEERLTHDLKPLLENDAQKIKYIGGDYLDKLGKYGNQFPELCKKVISKIGEVYQKDIEMQKRCGKRKMATFSLIPVIHVSTASNCIQVLNCLSKDLLMGEEEIYNLAGLNAIDIERNQKEWDDLLEKNFQKCRDPYKNIFIE